MEVSVAYAHPDEAFLVTLRLPGGATVRDAIAASGVLTRYPEIDLAAQRVGIFARRVALDTHLEEGDRVEIYRQLIAEPKEARRGRAKRG